MGALLTFFNAGPARIKMLLVGALAMAAVCLSLLVYALWWQAKAYRMEAQRNEARAERDRAIDQGRVLAGGLHACSGGVDQVKKLSDAALAGMDELLGKARKLAAPREKTIERIETVIHQAPKPGEGCDWAWDQLERERKARAP